MKRGVVGGVKVREQNFGIIVGRRKTVNGEIRRLL